MNHKGRVRPRLDFANDKPLLTGESWSRRVGVYGQKLAVDFLVRNHYKIETENFRTRQGEIDIIASQDGQVVFVEVKARLSNRFGLPEEAVTEGKLAKMNLAALKYLEEQKLNTDNFRFDIVAIEIDKAQKKAKIRHYKNIE